MRERASLTASPSNIPPPCLDSRLFACVPSPDRTRLPTNLSYDTYDSMSGRINARLDDELAEKVEELRRITGKSVSALIKAALEAYFENVKGSNAVRPGRVLEQAGFIACASGEPNLSRDYKRTLGDSLSSKT